MQDLNVEHAQLLLFLFHSLQLMQKKAILLLCAQSLVQAAQVSITALSAFLFFLYIFWTLSRLLVVIDFSIDGTLLLFGAFYYFLF